MKIIAGWFVAFAMLAGAATASDHALAKHKTARQSTVTASHQSALIGQPELASGAERVDRSRKGDRIAAAVRTTQTVLPPGCEPPFSRLAKFPSPNFGARCLT